MALHRPLQSLSDDHLVSALTDVVGQARRSESALVAHIAEVDLRRLYVRHACPSMFVYATRVLHLAEGEAFRRIRVARASRRHPVLLEMLADGRLHVSGVSALVPFLTAESRDAVLARAVHKTKRQIQQLVAELHPRPDVPAVMRKPPEPAAAAPAVAEAARELIPGTVADAPPALVDAPRLPVALPVSVVEPLSPSRFKIQFTASQEVHDDLERLRALLRSEIPDGDLAAIVGKTVRELRKRLDARRFAQTCAPRKTVAATDTTPSSRDVPAAIRRAVYRREGGRCCFVDRDGRRCTERHYLEYHHRRLFARGGDHAIENVFLVCGPHNRYLAEIDCGKEVIARHIRRSQLRRRKRFDSRADCSRDQCAEDDEGRRT